MGRQDTLQFKTVVDIPTRGTPSVNWAFIYNLDTISTPPFRREEDDAYQKLLHVGLSTIKQEMRTPLTLILQTAEMLADPAHGSLTEGQLDALTILQRQAKTLEKMVEGLMYVTEYANKHKAFKPEIVYLNTIFDKVIIPAEFKACKKVIEIETDLATSLPPILADLKQIEEALSQIIDNAIKFTQVGGTIKFEARANAQWVILTVTDTGIGIDENLRNKIWNLFEKGTGTSPSPEEGLGIGLSVARHIIEAHNGEIGLETAVGQGTSFTIKLPVATQTAGRTGSLENNL